jgi:hypothetical protein
VGGAGLGKEKRENEGCVREAAEMEGFGAVLALWCSFGQGEGQASAGN